MADRSARYTYDGMGTLLYGVPRKRTVVARDLHSAHAERIVRAANSAEDAADALEKAAEWLDNIEKRLGVAVTDVMPNNIGRPALRELARKLRGATEDSLPVGWRRRCGVNSPEDREESMQDYALVRTRLYQLDDGDDDRGVGDGVRRGVIICNHHVEALGLCPRPTPRMEITAPTWEECDECGATAPIHTPHATPRSEEHTSELQSR